MSLRVTFHDQGPADELAQTLQTGGFEAGVQRELFAGDDDAEDVVYVVHTDAPADEVADLLDEADAWIEVSDPMTGTSAPLDGTDLPDGPRR
jgi:hypothetical protein